MRESVATKLVGPHRLYCSRTVGVCFKFVDTKTESQRATSTQMHVASVRTRRDATEKRGRPREGTVCAALKRFAR